MLSKATQAVSNAKETVQTVKARTRNQAVGAALQQAMKAEDITGGDLSDIKAELNRQGFEGVMSESGPGDMAEEKPLRALRGFAADDRAQMSGGANRATNLVVGLVVGGLMAAFLLPIAIDEIASVDTTSWDSGAASLWNILPVIIVLAIFLFFVGLALSRR